MLTAANFSHPFGSALIEGSVAPTGDFHEVDGGDPLAKQRLGGLVLQVFVKFGAV